MANFILLFLSVSLFFAALPLGAQSLAPSSPAREHFYFAGRRVATDNFQNCQTVVNIIHNFPSSASQKSSVIYTLGGVNGCTWQFVAYSPSMVDNIYSGPSSGAANPAPAYSTVNVGVKANSSSTLPRTGSVSFGGQFIRFIQAASSHDPFYTFNDVANDASGHQGLFNYVALTKYYKVSNGCGIPGAFCPNDPLTKEQIAAFIIRSLFHGLQPSPGCMGDSGYPYSGSNTCGFTWGTTAAYADYTDQTNLFYPYVQKLKDLDLAVTCGTGYCGSATVTRGMMAEFIIRAMAYKKKFPVAFSYPQIPYFVDVPSNHAAFSYIQKLREQGITAGTNDTAYSPSDPLPRYAMAIFLIRAFFTAP